MVLGLAVVAGCSGDRTAAEIYCEERVACQRAINLGQVVLNETVDACVELQEERFAGLSEADRQDVDAPVLACESSEACGFISCYCNEIGSFSATCQAARQEASGQR